MTPDEFKRTTWREYVLMVRGFDLRRSYEFEHTRQICHTLAKLFSENVPSMEKWWPLITDEGEVQRSADEQEAMRIRIVQRLNKMFGKNLA